MPFRLLPPKTSRWPFSKQRSIPSFSDTIERPNEDELRILRSDAFRVAGGLLCAESIAMFVAWLLSLRSVAYSIAYPGPMDDFEFIVFCGWIGAFGLLALIAPVLAYVGFRLTATRTVIFRFQENRLLRQCLRGRWEEQTLAGCTIRVRRRRLWFGRGRWEVSLNVPAMSPGQDSRNTLIAAEMETRTARELVEEVCRRSGMTVFDLSGAFPVRRGSSEPHARPLGPVHETRRQLAARLQIQQVVAEHEPSIATWRMATGFSAVGIVITCLAPIALYLNQTGSYDRDPRGFIIGAIAALCFSGWQWKRALNRLGAALCSIESAAAVAPLLDLLAEGAASPSGHVRRALTKVLPKMMPGDGATISDLQRAALRRLLLAGDPLLEFDTSKLVELKRSVIKALAQIGDERDILALETMLASYPGDLREEVSDCLNSLLDRHDPTAPQQTLLRPVEAGAGDEALLRAAGSVFSEDGSALVRAVYDREGEASTDEVTLRLSTLSRGV